METENFRRYRLELFKDVYAAMYCEALVKHHYDAAAAEEEADAEFLGFTNRVENAEIGPEQC